MRILAWYAALQCATLRCLQCTATRFSERVRNLKKFQGNLTDASDEAIKLIKQLDKLQTAATAVSPPPPHIFVSPPSISLVSRKRRSTCSAELGRGQHARLAVRLRVPQSKKPKDSARAPSLFLLAVSYLQLVDIYHNWGKQEASAVAAVSCHGITRATALLNLLTRLGHASQQARQLLGRAYRCAKGRRWCASRPNPKPTCCFRRTLQLACRPSADWAAWYSYYNGHRPRFSKFAFHKIMARSFLHEKGARRADTLEKAADHFRAALAEDPAQLQEEETQNMMREIDEAMQNSKAV